MKLKQHTCMHILEVHTGWFEAALTGGGAGALGGVTGTVRDNVDVQFELSCICMYGGEHSII